jgi:hypothetical protein
MLKNSSKRSSATQALLKVTIEMLRVAPSHSEHRVMLILQTCKTCSERT